MERVSARHTGARIRAPTASHIARHQASETVGHIDVGIALLALALGFGAFAFGRSQRTSHASAARVQRAAEEVAYRQAKASAYAAARRAAYRDGEDKGSAGREVAGGSRGKVSRAGRSPEAGVCPASNAIATDEWLRERRRGSV